MKTIRYAVISPEISKRPGDKHKKLYLFLLISSFLSSIVAKSNNSFSKESSLPSSLPTNVDISLYRRGLP